MRMTPRRVRLLAGATLTLSLAALPAAASAQRHDHAVRDALQGALGVDTTAFDRSVRPQDDFNRFVNGSWIDRTEIPADRSSWGSFAALGERSEAWVKEIVEEAARADAPAGSALRKVGDLYASFMDSAAIEKRGLEPLRGELERVDALASTADLAALLARLQKIGVVGPVAAFVGQDQKDSDAHVVSVSQAGLGLPDRSYHLDEDARFAGIRSAYVDYLTRLFTLAGRPDPAGAAQRVLALETEIARAQWDRAKNRDRDATYNKMTVAELARTMPSFTWTAFLAEGGMGEAEAVVVRQPDYLEKLDATLRATPVATWREYLSARLLDTYASHLPAAFAQASFDFHGRTLSGLEEQRPRWKRGVSLVEGALGEAVGRLWVERHFQPEAKARMDELVDNLLAAFRAGIDELEWMSDETKEEARAKLASFTVKIGYPDEWRDDSALEIERDDLVGNALRASRYRWNEMVGRLGEPVDRKRWGMTPQTVNAYYNPVNNEIVFPAAILQPPFFDPDADPAVNYGAIGAVIGHEISHGFDDQGRKSDGEGNLRDWWTPADAQAFEERAAMLGRHFESYEPIDEMTIDARLTMGENIGDLSGLAVAYRAYRMSLEGEEAPIIGGFTGDQRFFMGWAQIWRTRIRDEALRQQLLTDPHSPGEYRAFVPLRHLDAFYEAFDVQPGDAMYLPPEERVKIW